MPHTWSDLEIINCARQQCAIHNSIPWWRVAIWSRNRDRLSDKGIQVMISKPTVLSLSDKLIFSIAIRMAYPLSRPTCKQMMYLQINWLSERRGGRYCNRLSADAKLHGAKLQRQSISPCFQVMSNRDARDLAAQFTDTSADATKLSTARHK